MQTNEFSTDTPKLGDRVHFKNNCFGETLIEFKNLPVDRNLINVFK